MTSDVVERVAAVVATYNPDPHLLDNLRVVLPQVGRVVVVDDGSTSAEADGVLADARGLGVTVLRSPENRGIAEALNRGLREVLADPAVRHVMTLDQDTTLQGEYVARAVAALEDTTSGRPIGLVACESVGGEPRPVLREGPAGAVPLDPFQSGMVVSRALLEDVGDFREDLFIDCVDVEFYLRAMNAGWEAVVAPGTDIAHELGLLHTVRWPGYVRTFGYHKPFRRYYIVRNRLALLREMRKSQPDWARVVVRNEVLSLGKGFVMGPRRGAQLVATLAGVRDFLRGRYGRIPERTLRRVR